ncbi:MAG: 2-hydroxyacyl-CoA dehydratase [Lachnospiraceae bacterium]|jgi:predicted CoA-substrate-specific enzyme activase|nr:2-hydroxyacyl-CoA dehydratase [Lachnospiraceae bacterium]
MTNAKGLNFGIDIGSTTVKVAVLNESGSLVFSDYERHFANIQETMANLFSRAGDFLGNADIAPTITGSGGLALAKHLGIPFVQEVVAVSEALQSYAPLTDVAIELGGEDAKIIYFEKGSVEQRMNGVCAGGTGSFIDQMASLLQTDATGLNSYAENYQALYPIAARCGVFAKSDIQPLINEGASREDLAASIFQAVVNQTISGLACGKPIRGHVAFLGGPLHFLPELRKAFIRTLKLDDEHAIIPENSHLFAAIGAAMYAGAHRNQPINNEEAYEIKRIVKLDYIREKLAGRIKLEFEVARLSPLFSSEHEYKKFSDRHKMRLVPCKDLSTYCGNAFLGIDAGSTTTKLALIAEDGSLLYSFYRNNEGDPLRTSINAIKDIYSKMPPGTKIVRSCSTGYGEALIKAALSLEEGEVETISHYYAAAFFEPNVDCILDIGGQDMKCIRIKNGAVDNVLLNEACSSGCGSFIETFAKSLNTSVEEFAREALFAKHPIDLGTRCTVFMNSKVKQAQKEGASVADISAGLAYSVIKNALFKVIKVSDAKELGSNIVVQGGTFYNDAVLRSFELIAECEAIRPDIAGIMGAFGAALIAMERYNNIVDKAGISDTTMLSIDEIEALTYETAMVKCRGCQNTCRLTVNKFAGGRSYISGNRCEKGLGKEKVNNPLPNLFEYREKRYFGYEPLKPENAPNGEIGIPRVLNIYENYPFWHTFFTGLGFSVVLSPPSTRKIYELGIESIPSESECYPAKLAHGHIEWLINKGIKRVFYPCIAYERPEFPDANNHYNCPIVTSYPENIKNNMDSIINGDVLFLHPFLSFASEEALCGRLIKEFSASPFNISESSIMKATHDAWEELENCRADMRKKGEDALKYIEDTNSHGIVLAGRPYHQDTEVHHGIPELIHSYNMAVLTEDSISHLVSVGRPLNVMDQWMYHSRLYAAAEYVKTREDLDLIQLNSFGCGLDAVTTDQVADILSGSGKIYTTLKVDEVSNLGSARIRVRSLLAAIRTRKEKSVTRMLADSASPKVPFTKEMRSTHTILCPQMSPLHFDLLEAAFRASGYNVDVLPNDNKQAVDMGLKYVNNDACFPSLMVVGQIMDAILSEKYDTHKLAVIISQTGGGCRATNYIGFIRRALKKAGYEYIPVVSLNLSGLEGNPGFKLTPALAIRGLYAAVFGDIFMKCIYRMRPYELNFGETNLIHEKWRRKCIAFITKGYPSRHKFKKLCRDMIADFDNIPLRGIAKPRVGVVGEILVKYMPAANNFLVELLEKEGAQAVVPDLLDFLCYCFYNQNFKVSHLGFKKIKALMGNLGISFIEWLRSPASKALKKSVHFEPPAKIATIAKLATDIVSLGNQTGEGWFLTGEMLELIHSGTNNIVCTQPFACLPNHIVGKGVIKELRRLYPLSNVVAIDFDPGASEVNQVNRLKLMLATAFKNLNTKENRDEICNVG